MRTPGRGRWRSWSAGSGSSGEQAEAEGGRTAGFAATPVRTSIAVRTARWWSPGEACGREVYIARHRNGILLGRTLGDGRELTTIADLAAAGVDLVSLR